MQWVDNLYSDVKQEWEKTGKDKNGFAIFYSPVNENAKIAIVGYNPGGGSDSFEIENIKEPKEHEYLIADYPMARKMKKIFEEAGLSLNDTNKFNLIFFRSRTVAALTNQELMNFSEQKVIQILNQLNPKLIITEGFVTFERLLQLKNGKKIYEETYGDKRILLIGEIEGNVTVLGLRHPTGARLSNEVLVKLGEKIKSFAKKL